MASSMSADERTYSPTSPTSPPPKMSHSYSSPAAVESGATSSNNQQTVTSPGPATGGKMITVPIQMLDDEIVQFQVQQKALGKCLFDQVCSTLHLLEADYFGLEYDDTTGLKFWLDHEKPLSRQIGLTLVNPQMRFCVKFFTPDPSQLEEEFTRYLFCLQIKRDLAKGILQCVDKTAALMASYVVQAECGDYVAEDYPDHTYLSSYKFVPHQDEEFENKIMENHKKHIGQSPAQADLNLLETARRCELYGIKMQAAKDHEGVPLNLAVAHMGVLVFQNLTKINTFSWAKVRKLSFKRKRFLIKLHPEGYGAPNSESCTSRKGYYKDTVEFFFDGRNECKNFWKKCVEHHGFFRCTNVATLARQKTRVISRGSSFRYSGRTQKQVVDYVRENFVRRQPFQRSQSFRRSSSAHSGVGHHQQGPGHAAVITSVSAQPLLPVDGAVSASQSCGSMALDDDTGSGSLEAPSPTRTESAQAQVHDQSPTGYSYTLPDNTDGGNNERLGAQTRTDDGAPKSILESQTTTDSNTATNKEATDDGPNSLLPSNNTENVDHRKPEDAEVEVRRKRYPTDKAYYIAKEILMTERTYRKDLELLNKWFREEVNKEDNMPDDLLELLFSLLEPIYDFHCTFLKEIEQRLSIWEGKTNAHLKGDYQRIGDIMMQNMPMLEPYKEYLDSQLDILDKLNQCYQKNKKFEQVYKEFEMQKMCYLPFNTFILKPAQRLMHYKLMLERLIKHYGPDHLDYIECKASLNKLKDVASAVANSLRKSENYVKLVELQRDIVGIDNLVQPRRTFIREGCLQKLSKKGFQQRMFFLFSDVLLYANRTATPILQFKIHGQLPLRGVIVEDCEPKMGAPNCFTIYSNNRAIIVSAGTREEKDKWLEDLTEAIQTISRELKSDKFSYTSLRSCSSSDEVLDKSDVRLEEEIQSPTRPVEKSAQQRSNTTVHVCWHRNTSVSMKDHVLAIENQLSGYLLRKFKNSNGWQKLWVVFTNFCLFFYKTFEDNFPLASLPLLGYTVGSPSEKDNIAKDYVFKLQFKNHIYFFRAESEYTFGRWMEVIVSATQHSGRFRLFSRKESTNDN